MKLEQDEIREERAGNMMPSMLSCACAGVYMGGCVCFILCPPFANVATNRVATPAEMASLEAQVESLQAQQAARRQAK